VAQGSQCGFVSDPSNSSLEPDFVGSPCFEVNEVFDNCTPLFINVNLHFFTDSDCSGSVQIAGGTQIDAFALGDAIINDANKRLAENPKDWNNPNKDAPCVPFRYVLNGVYMHCRDNVSLLGIYSLNTNYGVTPNTAINYYFGNYPGNSSAVANGIPGNAGGGEILISSDFNHEIGHLMGLFHANGNTLNYNDACDDTNPVLHAWDRNCDGVLAEAENELFRLCWRYIGDANDFEDNNENGVHDCDEDAPCTPSPCCSWDFQNNNQMLSAGSYQQAFTECQVKRMLGFLSTTQCGFITQIDGSAPPRAFITQTPEDLLNTSFCKECLVLTPSFNEVSHQLDVFTESTGGLAFSTGLVTEPAKNYCFTTSSQEPNFFRLRPYTAYRAVLTVTNADGVQSTMEYKFTTPDDKCYLDPNPPVFEVGRLSVIPNPGSGDDIQIEFEATSSDTKYECFAVEQVSGQTFSLLNNYTSLSGLNTVAVSTNGMPNGIYQIKMVSTEKIHSSLFIKL
jgi:hypothetical protein